MARSRKNTQTAIKKPCHVFLDQITNNTIHDDFFFSRKVSLNYVQSTLDIIHMLKKVLLNKVGTKSISEARVVCPLHGGTDTPLVTMIVVEKVFALHEIGFAIDFVKPLYHVSSLGLPKLLHAAIKSLFNSSNRLNFINRNLDLAGGETLPAHWRVLENYLSDSIKDREHLSELKRKFESIGLAFVLQNKMEQEATNADSYGGIGPTLFVTGQYDAKYYEIFYRALSSIFHHLAAQPIILYTPLIFSKNHIFLHDPLSTIKDKLSNSVSALENIRDQYEYLNDFHRLLIEPACLRNEPERIDYYRCSMEETIDSRDRFIDKTANGLDYYIRSVIGGNND